MSQLRAKFLSVGKKLEFTFRRSHCLLTISAGQQSHELERFAATIQLVQQSFKRCTVTLHDTLQRYTVALDRGFSPEAYHRACVVEGDLWLQRNERYLRQLFPKPDVIRWDEWLHHPDYLGQRAKIEAELANDPSYRRVFEETVTEFLARKLKQLNSPADVDVGRARRLCHEYLLEECAVLCLWAYDPRTSGCQFELYPGQHNAAMRETRRRFVYPVKEGLLFELQIAFNQRSALSPQQFVFVEDDMRLAATA